MGFPDYKLYPQNTNYNRTLGINKPVVPVISDDFTLLMRVTETINQDVNILFTTQSFNVHENGTLTVSV